MVKINWYFEMFTVSSSEYKYFFCSVLFSFCQRHILHNIVLQCCKSTSAGWLLFSICGTNPLKKSMQNTVIIKT